MDYSKKTVLVTGANAGIGFSIVEKFLSEDFSVIAICHEMDDNLRQIQSKEIKIFKCDFNSEKSLRALISSLEAEEVDILINNAAILKKFDDILMIDFSDLEETIRVNLISPFLLSQFALRKMIPKKSGRIVNLSSIGVKYGGNAETSPYTISKSGLEAMTRSFAKVGAPFNVLINCLRVGVTNTKIHLKTPNKNLVAREAMIPLKRMAEPKEIANFVYFLCAEQNSYITGEVISIAGGE